MLPCVCSLILAAASALVDSSAHAAGASAMEVRAVRTPSSVTVDGTLSEAAWQSAPVETTFIMRDPVENGRPSQRTEVRVLFDDDAIYVGARMYDTAPDSIIARLSRRDVGVPADKFTVYLDPYHDQRSGYYFQINAAGTLFDGTLTNDDWSDDSWDGVWEGHAKIDRQGWTAELRIPFSQLRFRDTSVWGINFGRFIQRSAEQDNVVIRRKNASGFVSRFPHLVGLSATPRRSIEVLPYLTNKAEMLQHAPHDPFHQGTRMEPAGGGDLRMGIGSGLTLNATVNPDFGQVEVDPAVVNLSDVESFFQEKRPFFVENSSIFDFGQQGASDYWGFNWPQPTFFYSRRIGRAPQGGVPDAEFSDVPVGTTILGAAKLTGKIGSAWNFGSLNAVTAREQAHLETGGFRNDAEIEPLTYYGVMRGLREFKNRQRGFGLMGTVAQRQFDGPGLEDQLNHQSVMSGFDGWTFLDKNQEWVISGWSAMSYVQGTQARISALQQSSRHYFQRPDAPEVTFDPNATSLTGFGSRYYLNKQKGKSFLNAAVGFMDPRFDVSDVGFQTRSDVINSHVGAGYKWTNTTKWRKYQDVMGAVFESWDFAGNPIWGGGYAAGSTEFYNNYSWNYSVAYNPETITNRLTRGGPLMKNKPGYEATMYFDTDNKDMLFYSISGYSYTQPEAAALNWNVFPAVEWKPVSNLVFSVGPGYEKVKSTAQYVTTFQDASATDTFGARYVFANLDQTTVSANLRLNCSFTPNLSVQLFAQPLISSGRYTDYKELAFPRSYAFRHYGSNTTFDPATGQVDPDGPGPITAIARPDLNFKSLRGNAVLRWEYVPGSTLYLVWTQERTDNEDQGEFNLGQNTRRLLKADANNIFLAKVSYYFNL